MVSIAIALCFLTVVEVARLLVDAIYGTAIKQELSDAVGELARIGTEVAFIHNRAAQRAAGMPEWVDRANQRFLDKAEEPYIPPAQPVKMPNDVLDYIEAESEDWAKVDRRNRAWELYSQLHDWQKVLQELGRDDGEVAEQAQL